MDIQPALPPYAHVTQEAVQCIATASARYQVPELLIHAILKKENGRIGSEVRNKNGTYDLGPAQINTIWLKKLEAFGIKREHIRDDFCTNVFVSAYILKEFNLIKKGNWFDAIVAYNIGPYKWTESRYPIGHAFASDVVSIWWGFQKVVDTNRGISRENLPLIAKSAKTPYVELASASPVTDSRFATSLVVPPSPLVFELN